MSSSASNRQWWVLVGTCLGLFILMLDSTVVALALPTIERDLDASADNIQWVLNGYLLVLSVLVVTAGRLGDIAGRRLVFVAGMAIFAAGSVLAAVAWDDPVLVVARAIQGIGGAAMLSLSLALVSHSFPDEQLHEALGIWAAVSALALAIGPLVGGALVDLDWRLIFWVNVPICAAGIAITWWAVRESRDETSPPKVDYPGLATLTPGMLAIVFALVRADDWGWGSGRTLGLIAVGAILLAAFWAIEHRVESPIVDFTLFRNGPYLGASAAAFCLVGAYWVVIFFQPQYLQKVLDHGPVAAGVLILPLTAPMVFHLPVLGPADRALRPARPNDGRDGLRGGRAGPAHPNRRGQLVRCCAAGLSALRHRARPRLRPDVDGGDAGDAPREGRHRGGSARHGQGHRRRLGAGGGRLDLPGHPIESARAAPGRRRRCLRHGSRPLDLGPGGARGRRRRGDLGTGAATR
jgi:MFS family permease